MSEIQGSGSWRCSLSNISPALGEVRDGISSIGRSTGLIVDTADVETLRAREECLLPISTGINRRQVAHSIPLPLTVTFGSVARGARAPANAVVALRATAKEVLVFIVDYN